MVALLFDIAADRLERCSGMNRLEVRGTLRLALKQAGLDPGNVSITQLRAIFEQLMPLELSQRGIADAEEVCRTAMDEIACIARDSSTAKVPTPDDVFKRLGGS